MFKETVFLEESTGWGKLSLKTPETSRQDERNKGLHLSSAKRTKKQIIWKFYSTASHI